METNNQRVRSVLLEVTLEAMPGVGVYKAPLPPNPQIRDCKAIIRVEAFNTSLQTKAPSTKRNLPDAAYKVAYLTIMDSNNTEVRSAIPLSKVIRSNGNSKIEDLNIMGTKDRPKPIDPERSFVTIADASTGLNSDVVLLEFTYLF